MELCGECCNVRCFSFEQRGSEERRACLARDCVRCRRLELEVECRGEEHLLGVLLDPLVVVVDKTRGGRVRSRRSTRVREASKGTRRLRRDILDHDDDGNMGNKVR